MKAIVYKGLRNVALEERREPQLVSSRDVIVRIEYTGVCGTDRNIYLGYFPAKRDVVLGHEGVGVVHSVGSEVVSLAPGDRVIVNPTLYCDRCVFCRRGQFNFCDNKTGTEIGVDRDGTFAHYAILPEEFLHKLPKAMSFERAVLVEPLACVLNNAAAARLDAADDVVVLGGGPIGMLWALHASRVALRSTLVESDPFRLEFARKRLDRVVSANVTNLVGAVVAANDGKKPRLVVDTTGVLLERGLEMVSKGGRVVVMGFNANHQATLRPLQLVSNGIQVIGAGDYNGPIFPSAIEMAAGMELEQLITHVIALDDCQRVFELLGGASQTDYGAMKVVVQSAA